MSLLFNFLQRFYGVHMPIKLEHYNLVYFPVPKIASSSFKSTCYFVKHGKDFNVGSERGGLTLSGHAPGWRAQAFDKKELDSLGDYEKIVIVRDPIERIVSAFWNRVFVHKDLSEEKLGKNVFREMSVRPNPRLVDFSEKIDIYRAMSSSVRWHTNLISYFIGNDLGVYDHVFHMSEIKNLYDFMRKKTGLPINFSKRNSTPGDHNRYMTPEVVENIKVYAEADFKLLNNYRK